MTTGTVTIINTMLCTTACAANSGAQPLSLIHIFLYAFFANNSLPSTTAHTMIPISSAQPGV